VMRVSTLIKVLVFGAALAAAGCGAGDEPAAPAEAPRPADVKEAGPLPAQGFRAELSLPDAPARLRAGERHTLRVVVKNASGVFWWARGGAVNTRADNAFYLAAGNRWLGPDGKLVTDMDGRHGLGKDLPPAEQTEVPLVITAPKEPGEYTLEVDLVQEQVSWFADKGSPTAKTKVTVIK
jgi:hypothetical protein